MPFPTPDIGIDLGTSTTSVYVSGRGIVISEPTVVVVERESKHTVRAVGDEAKFLYGRSPEKLMTVSPIKNGVVSDFDMTQLMIRYFLRKATDARRIAPTSPNAETMQILQSLGLIDDDGRLKNAALLLFGKQPLKFFPCVEFRIGRFGLDETDLMFQDSIDGNIIQMTDRVMEVLKSKYLISPIHYEGLQRIEPLEVPEDALREMIFNSIIHKDYTGVHIQLKVYNDRLVLWNDGALPDGYTIDTLLGDHASKPRNKNIAAVFYRAGFIESWGRGIRKICDGFAHANLPKPVFEFHCGGIRVTVMRPDAAIGGKKSGKKSDKKSDKSILEFIKNNPAATIFEMQTYSGLSSGGIRKVIQRLKTAKLLRRVGPDKGGHWEVIES